MKKFFKKIAISSFLATTIVSLTFNVNAQTINEHVDTIPDSTVIIGVTRFEPEQIVTSGKTITATGNFHRLYDTNEIDPEIYYYLGAWYRLDEENNATLLSEKIDEVSIFYVNNVEKMIEIPLEVNLPEGYELVFEGRDENVKNISYESGVLTVPATLKEFLVVAENSEVGLGYVVEEFVRNEDVFAGVVEPVSSLESLKEALNNKEEYIRLQGDITGLTETLPITYDVHIDGNGYKMEASGVPIFHVVGNSEDDVPTASLMIDNISLYNDTEAAIQVGSKGLLTDKETRLFADIGTNVYIECDEVGVLVYSKNSEVHLWGEIVINGEGAGIQGNGTNTATENYGDTYVYIHDTAKITANNKGLGLYIPQDGLVHIAGGVIEASTPVLIKSGMLNITDGTLKATGEYVTPIRNNNGGDATGDVIFVELNDSYEGGKEDDNIQVVITGGTLTSENGNILRVTNTSESTATYVIAAEGLLSAKVDNSVIYDYEKITAYADNEASLKDALLDKNVTKVELTEDIADLSETLIVNHDIVFDGKGHLITASDKNIFHVTGDANDEVPTATLTLRNVQLYDDTWAGVQVGSKGLLTDKETKLKVVIEKDVYIDCDDIAVLVYSKNSTVDFYGEIVVSNKDGFGIQGNGTNNETQNYGDTIINIYEGSKMTVNNNGAGLYIPQDGVVNIYGGTIEASTPIIMKSGKLNISGGTLTATGEYTTPIRNDNGGDPTGDVIFVELNKGYEGAKENDNIQVTITGGELTSKNGNILRVTKTTETDVTYIVNAKDLVSAKVDNSVIYDYEEITAYADNEASLKDALLSKFVAEIELTQDITSLTETLAVNHDVVFNGNGHSITASDKNIFHVTGDANDEVPTATLTLNNVKLYNDTWAGVQVGSKGLLTDKETKLKAIINEDVYMECDDIAVLVYSKNSTVDFYGEIVVSNKDGFGIQGNGTNDDTRNYGDTIINIYEGSKMTVNNNGAGLYIPQDGEVNIYGGTIEASTPIIMKSGKLNISGGTLKATGEYVTPIRNDNGGDPTGDVIFVELNKLYEGAKENDNIQVTITGGTLTSENGNVLRLTKTTETDVTYVVNADAYEKVIEDNSEIYNLK